MSKHTPGPWFVCKANPFTVRAGDDIDGRHVAHIGPANYTPRFDVDIPNAFLIAAAPELLADLEAAAEILRRYEGYHRAKNTEESTAQAEVNAELAERFEATIAKARGEA